MRRLSVKVENWCKVAAYSVAKETETETEESGKELGAVDVCPATVGFVGTWWLVQLRAKGWRKERIGSS